MAKIKRKRASPEVFSCKFGGMESRNARIGVGTEDICNFRADKSGTLRTRNGYRLYKSFSHGTSIRGMWEGTIGGSFYRFVSLGRILYRLDNNTLNETIVGTTASSQGEVQFCLLDDTLYLLDGKEIRFYRTDTGHFEKPEAYVPLYGRNWHPSNYGEVYEEINLLSPRLRVHYFNSNASTAFLLPFYADSVDVVRVDGVETTAFSFASGDNTVYLTSASVPTWVEIGFTIPIHEELREKILATPHAFLHTDEGVERLLLYGNDCRVFCSKEIDKTSLSACRVFYPSATSLYVRSDDVLFLGDAVHPVTAVTPLYDTLLALTAERVYSLRWKNGEPTVIPALEGIGCHSHHGVLTYKNEVLTLSGSGVYALRSSISHPESLSAERISSAIDGKLSPYALARSHLIRYAAEDEIWLRDPKNASGEVWVWNCESESWFRFSNVPATLLFRFGDEVGFATGGDLMVFDSTVHTDNGEPINSSYQSGYLDFGGHERLKRSFRGMLCASLGGGEGTIAFESEQGGRTYSLWQNGNTNSPTGYDFRAVPGRFRFLRFAVSLRTQAHAELYRCDIYTMP